MTRAGSSTGRRSPKWAAEAPSPRRTGRRGGLSSSPLRPVVLMNALWRTDPLLAGRFHASYPDDLQVIVHDGGPRLSVIGPELMWVRLTDVAAEGEGLRVYRGALLNRPH